MRTPLRVLLLALLLLVPRQALAACTFVDKVASGSPDTFTHTSGAMNSTTADTVVCYVAELESVGDTVLTDFTDGCAEPCNTWFALTEQKDVATASLRGQMRYCKNCTVGTGHKFKVSDTSGGAKGAVACAAFAGLHLTSPLDQQNGQVDIDAGFSNTTGGINPSEANTCTVTGLAFVGNSATIGISTGEAGWTLANQVDQSVNNIGVALAYKSQGAATPTDPTWDYTSNEYAVTSIASFKVAGAATAPSPASFQILVR